jgi:hypothetical protein
MMAKFGDWLILLLYVAMLFLLVRPGSQGPKLIDTTGKALTGLMNAATGGGGWSGKG